MKKQYIVMGILATLGIAVATSKKGAAAISAAIRANGKLAEDLMNRFRGVKEWDSSFKEVLTAMWIAGGKSETAAKAWGYSYAWSAAFISFVMVESGYTNFPVSVAHSRFFMDIKNGNYSEYKTHKIENYAPKVGDIVIKNRGGGKFTYDSLYKGASTHSDIIYKIAGNKAYTIGGNVSNAISETAVNLDSQGKIDNSLYFGIIEVI